MIKEMFMMDSFTCQWLMVMVSTLTTKAQFMMDNGNLTNKMDKELKNLQMGQYSKAIISREVSQDMVR